MFELMQARDRTLFETLPMPEALLRGVRMVADLDSADLGDWVVAVRTWEHARCEPRDLDLHFLRISYNAHILDSDTKAGSLNWRMWFND